MPRFLLNNLFINSTVAYGRNCEQKLHSTAAKLDSKICAF